jgi:hypothetical protein
VQSYVVAEHLERRPEEARRAIRVRTGPSTWDETQVPLGVMPAGWIALDQSVEVIDE